MAKRHWNNIVLCYHGCVNTPAEALTFRSYFGDWVAQLQQLIGLGYTFVKPSEYLAWFKGEDEPETPIACCQIDDGLATAEVICDYMVEHNIPWAFGLITRRQSKLTPETDFMSWVKIKAYLDSGLCELMSHTHNLHHLAITKNASGEFENAPIMEGPCWIDDGDVIYRDTSDTRWWWDFTFVDRDTLGFPLWGTDPYDGVTPIISSFDFTAKATFIAVRLRIWCALGRPSGAGYSCDVAITVTDLTAEEATELGTVTIHPVHYATRTQWVEREFYSLELPDSYSIVSGRKYRFTLQTLTVGRGCMLCYGVPDTSGNFGGYTTSRSLTDGKLGADWADIPPSRPWPIRACVVVAADTGRLATTAEYEAYINADMEAHTEAVTKYLNPTWTEVFHTGTEADLSREALSVVPLCGSYGDGTPLDTVIMYRPTATGTIELLRFKQHHRAGRRYPAIVDVFVGSTPTGSWTKIARWTPNWQDYGWSSIEITPLAVTAGTAYWLRFQTLNGSENDIYPLPPETSEDPELITERQHLLTYGLKVGFVRMLISAPVLTRYDGPAPDFLKHVEIDGVEADDSPWPAASNPDVTTLPEEFGYEISAYPIRAEGADLWPSTVFGAWTYPGDRRIYGRPFLSGMRHTAVAPLQLPTQIVYPFGAYFNVNHNQFSAVRRQGIAGLLQGVFEDNNLEAGYTIASSRHRNLVEHSEPACRCTEWAIPRLLVYGDQPRWATAGFIDAHTGALFDDAAHAGIMWHTSMEPDPGGNGTIRENVQAIDWIAMDAYFFDGQDNIIRGRLNDGGYYVDIASDPGTVVVGETLTGQTSGATAIVIWAANNPAVWQIKVSAPTGTFLFGETVVGSVSGASFELAYDAVIQYADDKAFLQSRGKKALLIINNNLQTGSPDPVIGSHVVRNPGVYIPKILAILQADNWDGLVCNLEAIPQADREYATEFYRQLGLAAHAIHKQVHATAPAFSNLPYDVGSEWWWAWCDHREIIKYVDGMKILTYTETGAGTNPGAHSPDFFVEGTYLYLAKLLGSELRKKILVGCNLFGHYWNTETPNEASYVEFHQGLADSFLLAAPIDKREAEIQAGRGVNELWFGYSGTVIRAAAMARRFGFMGLSIWKADDGDLYEAWAKYPMLRRR